MPVFETPLTNSNDILVRIERKKKAERVPGRQRKGFNSKSGMKSMTDKAVGEMEQPTVDKSPALIKHLRIIGKDKKGERPEDVLTAQGAALYEFLMASARIQGMEKMGDFRVSYDDAKKYLEIEHNARLEALATQLKDTKVEYDFKDKYWASRRGKVSLITTDFAVDMNGKKFILFQLHPAVIRVMLDRDTYTKLEINAFARFSCKYTARIYPRLALIAGYHPAFRKPWKISPEELAKLIGFTYTGAFHWGNFEKGCLKKVMDDIDQHVVRFEAKLVIHRKTSRGCPVEWLEFTTTSQETHLKEQVKAPFTPEEYKALNRELKGEEVQFFMHMPSTEAVRIGAAKTGFTPLELVTNWKDTLAMMYKYPSMCIPNCGLLRGDNIYEKFFSGGVGAAFDLWLYYLDHKIEKHIPVRSDESIHDTILRMILMDPEVALDYCDPTHPEWTKVSADWRPADRAQFLTTLSVMGQDNVDAVERSSFFKRIVHALNTQEPGVMGEMIGKSSYWSAKKFVLETTA